MFARKFWLLALAFALALTGTLAARTRDVPETSAFAKYQATPAKDARTKAQEFLTARKKTDQQAAFDKVWKTDHPVLDKLVDSFALADAKVANLVKTVRDRETAPSTEIPALLKDRTLPAFVRDNLTLFYATGMTKRRAYEEALEAFAMVTIDKVSDPASFYFHKAVCEYKLLMKEKADDTINALLTDVVDVPVRYESVAVEMHHEMLTWGDKDLEWIARQMDSIQRRLDLGRGGKATRRLQREVLVRLEEKIKRLEDRIPEGKGCPKKDEGDGPTTPGTDPGVITPPIDTPNPSTPPGTGEVDKKLDKKVADWGKLPAKERVQVIAEISRKMGVDRATAERYFKELQKTSAK